MDQIDEVLSFDPDKKDDSVVDDVLAFDPERKPPEMKAAHEPEMLSAHGEDNLSWKEALTEGFSNIPKSGWEYAKDIAKSVAHPVDTRDALVMAVGSSLQKLIPGKQGGEEDIQPVIDFYKNRYGSTEGFKKAISEDPIGVLGDIASISMATGGALGATGKVSKIGGLTKTGEKITNIATKFEPINLAQKIATSPLRLVPESFPIKMFQSAVKFGTTLSSEERKIVTKTAISAKNQIMPTAKGMVKLKGKIDDLNTQVNSLINNSKYRGHPVSVDDIYKGLEEIKNIAKRNTDEPLKWEASMNQIKRQIKEAQDLGPARSLRETQKIKTNVYRELESFYEKQKAAPARVDLRKAIARNAREQLEVFIPEIKQLNKSEGALIELWDAIESKANRITNRDFVGLGIPMKITSGAGAGYMFGGEIGGKIGASLGLIMGVYDTPQVKARLALLLNKMREEGIIIKPTQAAMQLGLFEIAKPEEFMKETQ